MKKLIILLLLFPALALAQDKCCVIGAGKCMPLKVSTDEETCEILKGNIVNTPCNRLEQCNQNEKCCIQKEYQQCFTVSSPAAAARCKGQIIDCQCPPRCRPTCQPE
jgi:hypothetical protein